jgi:hypothetical protein
MFFHRAEWLYTFEPPRPFQGPSELAELSKLFVSSNVLSSVSSPKKFCPNQHRTRCCSAHIPTKARGTTAVCSRQLVNQTMIYRNQRLQELRGLKNWMLIAAAQYIGASKRVLFEAELQVAS